VYLVDPAQVFNGVSLMNYRSELDGLRAVAVGLVMLSHAGIASLKGGFIGVDVFFVLSGYLITTIIYRELEKGEFTFRRFYERRIRRIMPALLLILFVCIPFSLVFLLPAELVDFSRASLSVIGFVSNVYYMFRGGYFRHELEENLLLHTWSLAVEEQFYIFFPILMILGYSLVRRNLIVLLVTLSIISLLLAEWGWRSFPTANFYATPMRAWELLTGSVCALYMANRYKRFHKVDSFTTTQQGFAGTSTGGHQGVQKPPRVIDTTADSAVGFATFGLLLILASAIWFTPRTPTPSIYTVIPVLGAALIILFGERDRTLKAVLTVKPMLVLGAISYSAYLWHQPVYALARIEGLFHGWRVLPAMLLTIVLAWCSWKFVENPFRNRLRLSTTKAMTIILCGCAVVVLSGIGGLLSKGYVSRYESQDQRMVSMDMIGFGEYVRSRFNQYKKTNFDSEKIRMLIIGDSYAKDFLNTLVESGYADQYSVSTHEFRPGCGNLMTQRQFVQHIPDRIVSLCKDNGWYDDPSLLDRIVSADYIVLASNWTDWEGEYIAESVDNISNAASGRVVVIGKKNFGEIDIREYLKTEFDQRSELRQLVPQVTLQINESIQRVLANDQFLNLQELVCQDSKTCRVFTDENELLSLDGTHLTPEGAEFVGRILFAEESGYFQRFRM